MCDERMVKAESPSLVLNTHYAAAELSRLLEAANKVCDRKGKQPELVVLRRLNVS